MDWDERFEPKRYTDPTYLSEGLFADYKSEIYPLRANWKKLQDFVVDFIALANMSYRFGRVVRLLFGMHPNMKDIVGVEGQSTRPEHLNGIRYTDPSDLHRLFNELILRDFQWAIDRYVKPKTVHLQMRWGSIQGRLCAYLEIGAEPANPYAYQVGEELRNKERVIYLGDSWCRRGESNHKLTLEEYAAWLSANDCPVFYGEQWRRYLDRLQGGDFAKAADLPGYQEPRFEGGKLLVDCVKEFLGSEQTLLVVEGKAGMGKTNFMQRLVKELAQAAVPYVRELPDDEPPAAWIPIYKELRHTPFAKNRVLDKFVINWWNANGDFFERRWPPKVTSILKRPGSRWLVCLDGLDEMSGTDIKAFYEALSEFREQYPRVKTLITTRPDAVAPAWEREGVVIKMSELDDKSVHNYLDITIRGKDKQTDEAKEKRTQARKMLEQYSGLAQLVRVPLYLDAYARFFVVEPLPLAEPPPPENISPITPLPAPAVPGEITPEELISRTAELGLGMEAADDAFEAASEASSLPNPPEGEQVGGASANEEDSPEDYPPPPLTQVLDRMVERIWEHDRKHFQEPRNRGSAWEPLQRLKHLAAKVDGRDRFAFDECHRVLKRVKWRARMLSLGLIELRNAWLFFPSRLLQSFLAADYLWHLWRGKRKNDLRQLVSADAFWRETQELFRELALPDREAVNFVSQLVSVDNGAAVAQPGR